MSEAVGGWQEVTLRVWFDPNSDARPEKWAWEEMLGTETHVLKVEPVEIIDSEGETVGLRDEKPEPEATDWGTVQFHKSAMEALGMTVIVWSPDDIIGLWEEEGWCEGPVDPDEPDYAEAKGTLSNLHRTLEDASIAEGWEVIKNNVLDALKEWRS